MPDQAPPSPGGPKRPSQSPDDAGAIAEVNAAAQAAAEAEAAAKTAEAEAAARAAEVELRAKTAAAEAAEAEAAATAAEAEAALKTAEAEAAAKVAAEAKGRLVTLDMSGVTEAQPVRLPVQDMPPLQKNGVWLAWGVLGLVLIFGCILLCVITRVELPVSSAEIQQATELMVAARTKYLQTGDAQHLTAANELLTHVTAMRRASRDFWTALSQMFLLNLLLPVLTAILGYVFGTKQT